MNHVSLYEIYILVELLAQERVRKLSTGFFLNAYYMAHWYNLNLFSNQPPNRVNWSTIIDFFKI